MKKLFTWIVDKWLAGFITASIYFTAKIYYDLPFVEKQHFWDFQWLNSVINYPINLWIVFLICAFIILMFKFSKWLPLQKNSAHTSTTTHSTPHYLQYTSDAFGKNKSIWEWGYVFDENRNTYIINDLRPICPKCSSMMVISPATLLYVATAECSRCRLEGRISTFPLKEKKEDVELEIIRLIKSNEYLQE